MTIFRPLSLRKTLPALLLLSACSNSVSGTKVDGKEDAETGSGGAEQGTGGMDDGSAGAGADDSGNSTGGTGSGGTANGGAGSGGTANGGAGSGGTASGGASSGGTASGGASSGGTASGGAGTGGDGTGGSAASTVNCTASEFTALNGYADNGTMCGLAWAVQTGDATITPACDTLPCFSGPTLCASGSIPPAGDEYPLVMLGWNVAQSANGETTSTWSVSGLGMSLDVTSGGANGPLRAVVVGATGLEYCFEFSPSGEINIPWSDFSVECWNGGAQGPNLSPGTLVTSVGVQINSGVAAQSFTDFCINSLNVN